MWQWHHGAVKFILAAIVAGVAALAGAQEPKASDTIRLEVDPREVMSTIADDFID